ncbi:MAG: flagellar biosynthetic protein FliQ [Gammaproteobacteria bacterium]|nr:flagellar biosynthetic protein FliQ [Gammaproteobacteria bacterium]
MSPELVLDIMTDTVYLIIVLLLIILIPALVVGLAVSMFMAMTSISEQTLTFIPKLLVTFGVLLVAGPYMMGRLMEFMTQMYIKIPFYLSGSLGP